MSSIFCHRVVHVRHGFPQVDARIVDEDLQAVPGIPDGLHGAFDLRLVGYVERQTTHGHVGIFPRQFPGGPLHNRAVDIGQEDVRALMGHRLRDGEADAAPGTSNESRFAVQRKHDCILTVMVEGIPRGMLHRNIPAKEKCRLFAKGYSLTRPARG